jgi:Tfp pilus assembly protein PilF
MSIRQSFSASLLILFVAAVCPAAFADEAKKSPAAEAVARGNAIMGNGKFDEAIAAYNEAIKADRNHADAFVGRARAYANKDW